MVERRLTNRKKCVDRETENVRTFGRFNEFGLRAYRQAVRALFWWLDCLGDLADYCAQRTGCGCGAGGRPLPVLVRLCVAVWVLVGTVRYR